MKQRDKERYRIYDQNARDQKSKTFYRIFSKQYLSLTATIITVRLRFILSFKAH